MQALGANRTDVALVRGTCAGLRDRVGQVLLSELAALPNVHLAASCDHVNTPLLWDMQARPCALCALLRRLLPLRQAKLHAALLLCHASAELQKAVVGLRTMHPPYTHTHHP